MADDPQTGPAVDPSRFAALVDEAKAVQYAGDHEAAARLFELAAAASPTHVGVRMELTRELKALNRLEEAEQVLDAVLALDRRHFGALAEKAHARRRAGDHVAAAALFEAAVDVMPAHVGARMELARDLRALGRRQEAAAQTEAVLQLAPDHVWALVERAHACRAAGDRAGAADLFARASGIDPALIGVKLELARDLIALGRADEALTPLQAAIAEQPAEAPVLLGLAHMMMELGRLEQARTLFQTAADTAPANAAAWRGLGQLARRRGDRAASRGFFEQAASADPDNLDLRLEVAAELRDAGELDEAARRLQEIIDADPACVPARLHLGHLERARGDRAAAAAAFVQAADLAPERAQLRVELAIERWALGEADAARALLDQALALEPDLLGALLTSAEWAMIAEAPDEAWAFIERARSAHPLALGPYVVGARVAAARLAWSEALALLDQAEAALGPQPELAATRVHILRQTRDHAAVDRVLNEARAAGLASFGLWNESTAFAIGLGRFEGAEAALAASPAATPLERALALVLEAQLAEGRRDYPRAVDLYRAALAQGPRAGGWQSELARCRLLLAQTDETREALLASLELDRSARQAKGQSANVSQHHVGQLLDEFLLDPEVLERLRPIATLPPEEQLEPLRRLVVEAPEGTAPALLWMLAARRAGRLAAPGAPAASAAIPRRIAQFWDADPPDDIAALMAEWPRMNPGWAYERFDDASAGAYIAERHPPQILRAVRTAAHPAQRSDLFRLAWLADRGGLYIDADDRCLQPLDAVVPPGAALFGYQENYGTLANNVLGAAPGHPVVLRALDLAAAAISRGDRDMVWLQTGPALLTRALAQVACADEAFSALAGAVILELWQAQRAIGLHGPAHYKRTAQHWSRAAFQGAAGRPAAILGLTVQAPHAPPPGA